MFNTARHTLQSLILYDDHSKLENLFKLLCRYLNSSPTWVDFMRAKRTKAYDTQQRELIDSSLRASAPRVNVVLYCILASDSLDSITIVNCLQDQNYAPATMEFFSRRSTLALVY